MKYYIKILTGYREDQQHTVEANEAHKAYYLFNHTEKRGIFNNGLALIGSDIKSIEPDYNATMGWAPTYKKNDYDWIEIKKQGVEEKMKYIMGEAKTIATNDPQKLNQPLSVVLKDIKHKMLSLKQ